MAMSTLSAIFVDLALLAGLTSFGYLLMRLILPNRTWPECLALAFPIGAGTFSWFVFLWSLVGLRISITSLVGSWLVLTLAAWVLLALKRIRLRGLADAGIASPNQGTRAIPGLALAATGVLIVLSLFLSIGRAQAGWDAMAIWSAKGYGIALEGSIRAGSHWGEHGLSYPLNIPLLISFFAVFDADLLPGSKLIFPMFYASLLAGCYLYWRRQELSASVSSLGLLTVASVPVIYDHATLGYANLPEACYLVLGSLYMLDGALEESRRALLASSLLFGLAVWTRPEGALLVLVAIGSLILTLRFFRIGKIPLGTWLIALALIGGSWLIFTSKYTGGSQFWSAFTHAWRSWLEGRFNLYAVREIASYSARLAIDPSVWGVAAPLLLLLIWFGRRRLSPRAHPGVLPILLTGVFTGAAVLVFYYLASFSGPPLDWWLSTGLNRTVIPSVCLLIVGAFLAAGGALPEAGR